MTQRFWHSLCFLASLGVPWPPNRTPKSTQNHQTSTLGPQGGTRYHPAYPKVRFFIDLGAIWGCLFHRKLMENWWLKTTPQKSSKAALPSMHYTHSETRPLNNTKNIWRNADLNPSVRQVGCWAVLTCCSTGLLSYLFYMSSNWPNACQDRGRRQWA